MLDGHLNGHKCSELVLVYVKIKEYLHDDIEEIAFWWKPRQGLYHNPDEVNFQDQSIQPFLVTVPVFSTILVILGNSCSPKGGFGSFVFVSGVVLIR